MDIFSGRNTFILQRLTFCWNYYFFDEKVYLGLLLRHFIKNLQPIFFSMNLAQAKKSYVFLMSYHCPCQIHRNFLAVIFCWNVLVGAPGGRLYQKNFSPSKMLTSVKILYSYSTTHYNSRYTLGLRRKILYLSRS